MIIIYQTQWNKEVYDDDFAQVVWGNEEHRRLFRQIQNIDWCVLIFSRFFMYTMEYYSAIKKNAFESVLMSWMKLGPILQKEVSLK